MAWKTWHVETESTNPANTAKGGQMVTGDFATEESVTQFIENEKTKVVKVTEFVNGKPVETDGE